MDPRSRAKADTQKQLAGAKFFDAQLHAEIVDTYLLLAPVSFADHSTLLLNAPTAKDRIAISSAIRALGNSKIINYLLPAAVTTARLYYLVAFLEGMVMPQLQVLVSLCEQQGHVASGKPGKDELRNAKSSLGPALTYLSGTGAPALLLAPRLAAEISWASSDKIAQLRNSIAHFRFRLDEAVTRARDIPSVQSLGKELEAFGLHAVKGLAVLLGLPAFDEDRMPDYEKSSILYEENLNRPVLPTSRRRTYREIREILERVERLGLTMLFASLDVGKIHQAEGMLCLGQCGSCGQGTRAGAPGGNVSCPVCSHSWTF